MEFLGEISPTRLRTQRIVETALERARGRFPSLLARFSVTGLEDCVLVFFFFFSSSLFFLMELGHLDSSSLVLIFDFDD